MFRPRVIPVLLLQNKGLVKTTRFKKSRYVGDAMNAVRIFNAKEADELIFLDINASAECRTISLSLVEKIGYEAYMPFTVGGGIGTVDDIRKIIHAGAEKVALNTAAIENPQFVREAADAFGSSTIVVSIDVRKKIFGGYNVYIRGGRQSTGLDPIELSLEMERQGAGEVVINSIDRDGLMVGYDIDLIKAVSDSLTIPVVALGGCGQLDDLRNAVLQGNASAVAAGSFFVFQGKRRAVLISFPTLAELQDLFLE